MKIIFLDIDGVLVNRWSLSNHSGIFAKAHPDCVAALNRITDETGARVVVSSTWRKCGISKMRGFLNEWGVTGKAIGCTPDLSKQACGFLVGAQRGDEIQCWLDERELHKGDVESFVILDDDSDMKHLTPHLVRTTFEYGLTMKDAERAIELLQDVAVSV
jgi:hypothetical protein